MEDEKLTDNSSTPFPEGAPFEGSLVVSRSKFNDVKDAVSDSLRSAASTIQDRVGKTGEHGTLSQYGEQASHWLNASADYVRELDLQKVNADVQDHVRRNPGRSLLIAAAAGLIIGSLFRRR